MDTLTASAAPVSASTNDQLVRDAFAQPQWYLTKTAFNIRIRLETLRHFLGGGSYPEILDLGCGDGSLSVPLLTAGNQLTLVDRSRTMLDIAAAQVPSARAKQVTYVNDNVVSVPLAPRTFDLVVCVGLLAYIEDLPSFVAKLRSLVKPGGTLILECSDGTHFVRRAFRGYDRVRRIFGASNFDTVQRSSATVCDALAHAGFKQRAAFRYCWVFPIIRKFLSQGASYRIVRTLYGSAARNRSAWLGSECIFRFDLPTD